MNTEIASTYMTTSAIVDHDQSGNLNQDGVGTLSPLSDIKTEILHQTF